LSSKFYFQAKEDAVPDVKDLQYLDRLPGGGTSSFNSLMNAIDWLYKPPVGKLDKL